MNQPSNLTGLAHAVRSRQLADPASHPWMIPEAGDPSGLRTAEGASYNTPWARIDNLNAASPTGFSEGRNGTRTLVIEPGERFENLTFQQRVVIHESNSDWSMHATDPAWGSVRVRSQKAAISIPLLHYGPKSVWSITHGLTVPLTPERIPEDVFAARCERLQQIIEKSPGLLHAGFGSLSGGLNVKTNDPELLALAIDCGFYVRNDRLTDDAPEHQRLSRTAALMTLLEGYAKGLDKIDVEELKTQCRTIWTPPSAPWKRNAQLQAAIDAALSMQQLQNAPL